MGNHKKVEAEIKAVMGENTKVVHKFAMPTTVVSIVDGKKGSRECLPLYYLCPKTEVPGALNRFFCVGRLVALTRGNR